MIIWCCDEFSGYGIWRWIWHLEIVKLTANLSGILLSFWDRLCNLGAIISIISPTIFIFFLTIRIRFRVNLSTQLDNII
jgi:hypothetical protein